MKTEIVKPAPGTVVAFRDEDGSVKDGRVAYRYMTNPRAGKGGADVDLKVRDKDWERHVFGVVYDETGEAPRSWRLPAEEEVSDGRQRVPAGKKQQAKATS